MLTAKEAKKLCDQRNKEGSYSLRFVLNQIKLQASGGFDYLTIDYPCTVLTEEDCHILESLGYQVFRGVRNSKEIRFDVIKW